MAHSEATSSTVCFPEQLAGEETSTLEWCEVIFFLMLALS
jgi:hypothetical protein